MFSHRRSCKACVKSKRRCDLRLPKCGRCSSKAILCNFENEPLACRQGSSSPPDSAAGYSVSAHSRSTGLHQPSTHLIPQVTAHESKELPLIHPSWSATVSINYEPLLPEVKWRNNKSTVCYLASKLKGFPATFVREGRTPFIHHQLYAGYFPPQIREAYRLCASCAYPAEQNEHSKLPILELKFQELVTTNQRSCSFDDILASVQALMLYLIICLFNNSASIRDLGQQHYRSLDRWTRRLWEQAPSELSGSLTPWQAWVFAESVRRSILISHMIRGVYDTIKQGYHVHTLFLEALPFDPQTSLWDAPTATEWEIYASSARPRMVSYREYVNQYSARSSAPSGLFERLLLIACCGKEKVVSNLAHEQALVMGLEQNQPP